MAEDHSLSPRLERVRAAGFPVLAKQNRTTLVILNREATGLDGLADLVVNAESGPVLSAVMARLDQR